MKPVNVEREQPRRSNTRNSRRWCKGKRGVEHAYVWLADPRYDYAKLDRPPSKQVFKHECVQCGRIDDLCFPLFDKHCRCGHHNEQR